MPFDTKVPHTEIIWNTHVQNVYTQGSYSTLIYIDSFRPAQPVLSQLVPNLSPAFRAIGRLGGTC